MVQQALCLSAAPGGFAYYADAFFRAYGSWLNAAFITALSAAIGGCASFLYKAASDVFALRRARRQEKLTALSQYYYPFYLLCRRLQSLCASCGEKHVAYWREKGVDREQLPRRFSMEGFAGECQREIGEIKKIASQILRLTDKSSPPHILPAVHKKLLPMLDLMLFIEAANMQSDETDYAALDAFAEAVRAELESLF
jgi:hypothetical protein